MFYRILILSLFFNMSHGKKPNLTTNAKLNVDTLVEQAEQLVDKKNEAHLIVESCFDLISQIETNLRDQLHALNNKRATADKLSDQQIEDQIQKNLMDELNNLISKLLEINKNMAKKLIDKTVEPSRSIRFAK